jgi:hypothetical protein
MLPQLGASKLVSRWIAATLAASIVAAVDAGWLASWAAFAPSRIWRGELWRLVTWIVLEPSPIGLAITCLCIYKFGGDLAVRWGERRLRRFMIEVLGGSAIAAALIALISRDAWSVYAGGGWAVRDALVIAWARQFPNSPLSLYGIVTLNGRNLIRVTVAITVLVAIYAGPLRMPLELLVCAAVVWYPAAWLTRRA